MTAPPPPQATGLSLTLSFLLACLLLVLRCMFLSDVDLNVFI
jgi:hypothetical protein